MKKLLTMLMLVLSISMSSQVYSIQYTHYSQMDTISKQMMPNVSYNTIVFIDYYHNQIVIEDNDSKFPLNIIYNSGSEDNVFYECLSDDKLEWKVSIMTTRTEYLCVVTRNNFTRIYKKSR